MYGSWSSFGAATHVEVRSGATLWWTLSTMACVVDTVHQGGSTLSQSAAVRPRKRHGDLRNALLHAGMDLARAGGPDAVVLRAATRRAGVAPNAAYRHFTDRAALLQAVCAAAMAQLARAMEAEQASVPPSEDPAVRARGRLRAVGTGYLRYAQAEPGLFRTAFSSAAEHADPQTDADSAGASGLTPFQLLSAALDDVTAAGLVPAEHRPDAEFLAWSAVHGLAMLVIDGPLRALDREHVDRLSQRLLDLVDAGL